MPTHLRIRLDGPAFTRGGLSLATFHPSLFRLLKALRRIGSAILTDATGTDYGAKGGRWARYAASLDYVIHELVSHSPLELVGTIIQPAIKPSPLFPDWSAFTDQVALRLLDALEHEQKGEARNYVVRQFLESLPAGVEHQVYTLETSLGDRKEVTIGGMNLLSGPKEIPYLQEIIAQVVGVGFEPGRIEVRFKLDGQIMTCSATNEQVEAALEMRARPVKALVVRTDPARLLRLNRPDDPPFVASDAMREQYIFNQWNELLARLAK